MAHSLVDGAVAVLVADVGNPKLGKKSRAYSDVISGSLTNGGDGLEDLGILLESELHAVVDGQLAGILCDDSGNDPVSGFGEGIRGEGNILHVVFESECIGSCGGHLDGAARCCRQRCHEGTRGDRVGDQGCLGKVRLGDDRKIRRGIGVDQTLGRGGRIGDQIGEHGDSGG